MPHSRHRLSSSLAHQPVSGVQLGMSFVRVVLPGSPYPPAMSLCVSWLCSVAGHSPSPSASAAAAAAAGCVVAFFCLSSKKEEAAAAESKSGRQNGQRQPHSEFSPSPFRLNHNNNHNTTNNNTSRSSDSSDSSSQVFSFRPPLLDEKSLLTSGCLSSRLPSN
ncbi:uncharacterized protein ARB_06281 [Trichophyton benhamiae CBS 112371]|uniref:Uncharacterized protein n=1 Tax=Arthroderma benhamiae (strain ATCC MYA-4681 / CBS 112371) TaxID=663331 RepID=D4APW3_ARTBC|nr:uncharacterized protein ARB_06281 [Trichophyton benhamiae CBS 112371]EFE35324.1 hypothetical protein ARB_06281 [Trichophyton benhamiae CBS 112371]